MRKPGFGVVTGVVTVLALLAFIRQIVVPAIPPAPANSLASEPGEFMVQASHQQIDWHALDESTFQEARRKDKPIMLVVGSACSWTGRYVDKNVFSSDDIRSLLARNFISVRVDAMEYPEFANAFLPLSRMLIQNGERLFIRKDFEIWFLDPQGNLLDYAAQTRADRILDSKLLLARLVTATERYQTLQDQKEGVGEAQKRDLNLLRAEQPLIAPDVQQYLSGLAGAIDPDNGGLPANGFQLLHPNAWRLQLLAGRRQQYTDSIGPALRSRIVDVLDGGFFTSCGSPDWQALAYDKLAVENAGMLLTLSTSVALQGDPAQRWIALRTFDCLASQFYQSGYVAAGRVGDETSLERSRRSSSSPRQLRDIFPDSSQRELARQVFGLRVEENPQMSPRLVQPTFPLEQPKLFDTLVGEILKGRPEPKYAGLAQLDVGGFSVARMLESARLLGDMPRLTRAEGIYERLDDFRTADDVVHSLAPGATAHSYLGDYLAYADASLQYFLATGNSLAFTNGLAVLRRGLFLFEGKVPGEYTLSQPSGSSLAPQDAAVPEIIDDQRESCSAQVLRLTNAYGQLLGPRGEKLRKVSADVIARFGALAPALGQFSAGFYCAVLNVEDGKYGMAVGPDAVIRASALAARAPGRLVAPGTAPLDPVGTEPGYYVISSLETKGPLTLDKAAAELKRRRL